MSNDNCCFRSKPVDKEFDLEKGRSLGIIKHDKSTNDQIIKKNE